nr:hypothetical protein [uncultured Sphingomonas sp.]
MRLTHVLPRNHQQWHPGVLGFVERSAFIDSHSAAGPTAGVPIGTIIDERYDWRDFDGWALETIEHQEPFFVRLPDYGSTSKPLNNQHSTTRGCLLKLPLDQTR